MFFAGAFLDWPQWSNEHSTYESDRAFVQSFADLRGATPVPDLKPYHLTRWLDGQAAWGQGAR